MAGDAIEMLKNVGEAMNMLIDFVKYPSYIAGVFCLISGLIMLTSQRTEGATGKGIMLIFIAGMFACLPYFVSDLGTSLLALSDKGDILSVDYKASSENPVRKAAIFAIFTILRLIGIIAIYKGCNRLKFYNVSPNGDPRLVSEAMTLIIMGTFATFSEDFVKMIAATVGGSFMENVNDFLS